MICKTATSEAHADGQTVKTWRCRQIIGGDGILYPSSVDIETWRTATSGKPSRMAAPSFMANARRRRKAADGRRPPEMRRHPLRSQRTRRHCHGDGHRARFLFPTDITADGHGMADGANAGVLAGFSPSLDIGKAKGKRLAERQAEGQTVTAWRERRQINRPDDDGRHMTDGHGGRSGHDGRDSRGTPAQATTEKILGSSAGGWFHACRGNGWHIRYSLFQGLYSYPKRQKQKAKTKPLIFM